MWIYSDRIYYAASTYKNGYEIRYITKDGKETAALKRESYSPYPFITGFDNRRIYYSDDTKRFYYADLDLKNETYLFKSNYFDSGFVCEGKIYFFDSYETKNVDGEQVYTTIISAYDIESGEKTKIKDNVCIYGGVPMVFRSGTRLYYGDSNPKKMGTAVYNKYTGELGERVVFDYSSKKIYYYDMVTGENGVYIEDLGANMGQIYYADENVAVLYNFYYDYDFNDPEANTADCYVYNIKKKAKSLIFGVTY